MIKLKEFFKELIDFWSSIKVAVTLLALAAIATLVGSILPQEISLSREELINNLAANKFDFLNLFNLHNGAQRFVFMKSLGLTNVFFSNWYLTLMLLMYVSIILSSFTKVFPKAKAAFIFNPKPPKDTSSKSFVINNKICGEQKISLESLEKLFSKNGFKTQSINFASNLERGIFAHKGAWHKLGASITHVGIILTITGACIGMLTGFGGFTTLSPGEDMILKNTDIKHIDSVWLGQVPDLKVKVLKTWKEEYENGTPKQYYSELELYDNVTEKLIQKHLLKVNQPLKYKNFYIYQNTFGEYLKIAFNDKLVELGLQKFGQIDASILDISKDFSLILKPIKNKTGEDLLDLSAIVSDDIQQVIELGIIKSGDSLDLGPATHPVNFKYIGKGQVTGLQYKSNPGAPFLYLGFLILITGVFTAFGAKRELWITQTNNDIMIFGKADKFQKQFKKEIEDLLKTINGELN